MKEIVVSNSYGSGFYFANRMIYDWMNEHGCAELIEQEEGIITSCVYYYFNCSRDNEILVECVKELGEELTGYRVVEYDDNLYTYEIDEYDGLESLRLIPIINIDKIMTMSKDEIIEYFNSLDIVHNYSQK